MTLWLREYNDLNQQEIQFALYGEHDLAGDILK